MKQLNYEQETSQWKSEDRRLVELKVYQRQSLLSDQVYKSKNFAQCHQLSEALMKKYVHFLRKLFEMFPFTTLPRRVTNLRVNEILQRAKLIRLYGIKVVLSWGSLHNTVKCPVARHTRPELRNFTDFLLKEFWDRLTFLNKAKNIITKESLKEYFKRNSLKIVYLPGILQSV